MHNYHEMQQENARSFEYIEVIAKGQAKLWDEVGFDAHFHDLSDGELIDILKIISTTSILMEKLVARIIGYDIPSSEGVA